MLLLELLLFLFSVHSLASPFQRTNVRKMVRAADAPYSVDTSTLAASLTCPYGNPTAASPAVLLVHGTSSTGEDSWAEGYAPALKANGYSPCWVTLRECTRDAIAEMRLTRDSRPCNGRYAGLR